MMIRAKLGSFDGMIRETHQKSIELLKVLKESASPAKGGDEPMADEEKKEDATKKDEAKKEEPAAEEEKKEAELAAKSEEKKDDVAEAPSA